MPFIHPERRLNRGGLLTAYEDELPALYAAGIRAVVSLLNIPSDTAVYEALGLFTNACRCQMAARPPSHKHKSSSLL